ncbi:MAG: RnfABCDGE type electron transport complex subunit G [Candidatus Omnitrophota bacterium]
MQKNNYVRYAATLAIICLAASGLLSVVYNVTRPKILAQQQREEEDSLKEVLPQAKSFEPMQESQDVVYYKALDSDQKVLGYAFKASQKGYSSEIVTMVGMTPQGEIIRIKILSQNETPGLGTRIAEVIQKDTFWDIFIRKIKPGPVPQPWFQEQFSGKKIDDLDSAVNAITGATISSSAVIDSVKTRAKEIMEKIRHGQ